MTNLHQMLVLLIAFTLGVAVGTDWTRVECVKNRCAVPCGLKQVTVDKTPMDWTEWTCRCAAEKE